MLLAFVRRATPVLLLPLAVGCPSTSPSDETGSTGDGTGDSSGGVDDGDPMAGGELLGCPGASCVMLLATQSLDDRVEVFVPDHPSSIYRGAIDLDLKPNLCEGCMPGDNGDDRLDEPFGMARAGGFLHVLVGHYPERTAGSLVAFPLDFFVGYPQGGTVPVADYYADGQFLAPVVERALGEVEAIFMHRDPASGRLVVGVFNNDLFATEDTWTQVGKLLVIDPGDPGGELGTVVLDGLAGGPCQGAGQVIDVGGGVLAVACDGNEAVAMLDASGLGTGTVGEAASSLASGALCPLPGALPGRRVRYLAPDGSGGVLVTEGPTPLDLLGGAELWHLGSDCGAVGTLTLPASSDWQLGEVVRLPASVPTWLLAAGSANPMGQRGVFVVHEGSGALELCPDPVGGFEGQWDDGNGGTIEPFALAVTRDGTGLAVGAGPFIASADEVGYGKVLWASLSGADPCSLSATVSDLTDGGTGHAPAPVAGEPSTWRRAPNVVVLQELGG